MKAPLYKLHRRPGFLLKRCNQVTSAIFIDRCREFNITPSQYGALCALREFPGIDQLAVGRLVGLDRSTAGLVVKLLAERGLVERSVNERDSRSMHLKLSPAGSRALAEIEPLAARAQKDALAALPRSKQGQFLAILEMFLQGHEAIINPQDVVTRKTFGSQFDALSSSPRRDAEDTSAKYARKPTKRRRFQRGQE